MTSLPTEKIDTNSLFGFDPRASVLAFDKGLLSVPEVDPDYYFDPRVTEAILLGFSANRRVFIHGQHGGGKSSHIEQIAARLNWPCVRLNLDGHVSRSDLVGRDTIVIEDGKQVTRFKFGILTWAMQNPVALVLDEYDAGRPDVMFVLQRVLEAEGKLTLPEENQVIEPHPAFRIFATANTLGMGDASGQYIGTQPLNQAQLDRWHIICELLHLPVDAEHQIIREKAIRAGINLVDENIAKMIQFANLTRTGFQNGELSTFMSLRGLLTWTENYKHLNNIDESLRLSYINRCDYPERPLLGEFFQRCFGTELAAVSLQSQEVF